MISRTLFHVAINASNDSRAFNCPHCRILNVVGETRGRPRRSSSVEREQSGWTKIEHRARKASNCINR
jgi:hypothetical protein